MGGGGYWYPLYTLAYRKIYRHASGYGSVLEYKDEVSGLNKSVLILDAAYRTTLKFGAYNVDSALPNLSGDFIFRRSTLDRKITLHDPNTSTYNCDLWMTYTGKQDSTSSSSGGPIVGVPAVEYCRSIVIPTLDRPCDLPNINILTRIGIERDYIDRLDPTIADYPTKALGKRNPDGPFSFGKTYNNIPFLWSSTDYDAQYVYTIYYHPTKDIYYAGSYPYKYRSCGVVPIVELT